MMVPGRLGGPVEHRLPLKRRGQPLLTRIGHHAGLIVDRHRAAGLRTRMVGIRHQAEHDANGHCNQAQQITIRSHP